MGTHEVVKVQIIDHCDPNDQEAREDFWILDSEHFAFKRFSEKRALKYWINWFSILMSIFDLTLLGNKKIIAWYITNTYIYRII